MITLESFREKATQALRDWWPKIMGCSAIYCGLGYTFGPESWYSTPSLELVRRFVVPIPVWGVVMLVAGLLILIPKWQPVGHFIAALLWIFWFFCIFATAVSSLLAEIFGFSGLPAIGGWGAPAYVLIYASAHAYMLLMSTQTEPDQE